MHLYFYIQCHCKFNPSRSSKITSKQPGLLKTLNFSFIFPFLKFRNFYLYPLPPPHPPSQKIRGNTNQKTQALCKKLDNQFRHSTLHSDSDSDDDLFKVFAVSLKEAKRTFLIPDDFDMFFSS